MQLILRSSVNNSELRELRIFGLLLFFLFRGLNTRDHLLPTAVTGFEMTLFKHFVVF